jgi:biotin-dependent carboxylase-like uncharacterized protein
VTAGLTVVDPGWASTLQDRGRPGFGHLGVPAAGAVDADLAALANRLVGNPPGMAVIETSGGLVLEARRAVLVASTVEGIARPIAAGQRFRVPSDQQRVWHYVAVRGGIDVPAVLGSCSTDTLSGLGPSALSPGDELAVGPDPGGDITAHHVPLRPIGGRSVRITPGPRMHWFGGDALVVLTAADWTIAASSRVGVRLTGPEIAREVRHELPSEGLVRGAVQIPPDGAPVMMLADHPTTGGYPVIAVVHPDDVALVAQTSAGRRVRFTV